MPATITVVPNPQNGLNNSNGVSNGTTSPVQETRAPVPVPGNTPDPAAQREAQLKAREDALAAREQKYQNELKKNALERKSWGPKLTRLQELEKYHAETTKQLQLAKLNPNEFLKSIYGDEFYKLITDTQVNGVPPAQLIAAELQKVRDDFKKELENRDQQAKELSTKAMQREVEETRTEVAEGATAFYEANQKDYPVFKKLGDAQKIGQMLAQRIENQFLSNGKLLSEKEAADGLENDILSMLDEAVGAEKYKERLTGKAKGEKVDPSSGVQGVPGVPSNTRRTLTNTMTASTSGRTPPRSDAERLQRSIEAFNAARKKE